MKRALTFCLAIAVAITGISCTRVRSKYQTVFYDVFDTVTSLTGYCRSEKEFNEYAQLIYGQMLKYHQFFDIYNDYSGINNLKTINDNAGKRPVQVDPEVIELLELGREAYERTEGVVNIAMGAVLRLWHEYRDAGMESPQSAQIPPMELLSGAAEHVRIEDMVIDKQALTVYLRDPEMALDVGAIAKGFAVRKAGEAALKAGFDCGLINAGGNVLAVGKPLDGRESWSIGIQDVNIAPDGSQGLYDVVYANDTAVVTSGDYQRFYTVDGKNYNHIIDPGTLMSADRFRAVTILCKDSGWADALSTALFVLPYEQGRLLAQEEGIEALWIMPDETAVATSGYKDVSQKFNAEYQKGE